MPSWDLRLNCSSGERSGSAIMSLPGEVRQLAILLPMSSVADRLRDESRRRVLDMSPAARLALALRLGDTPRHA